MPLNKYDTVVDAIQHLRRREFTDNFKLDKDMMRCLRNDKKYAPADMRIVEYHRFEGRSDPGDMSIVFAVECDDGVKGIVTSSYGPYADMELVTFMSKVRVKARPEGATKQRQNT